MVGVTCDCGSLENLIEERRIRPANSLVSTANHELLGWSRVLVELTIG
jgi:hypothetical protein